MWKVDRVLNPAVLIVSFVFNIYAMVRIRLQQQTIEPLRVHDADLPTTGDVGWASYRNVRYNKALFTNAATPFICIFLLIGVWITAKKAMMFPIGEEVTNPPCHILYYICALALTLLWCIL